jgi:hypothetical protein
MGAILAAAQAYLSEQGWSFTRLAGRTALQLKVDSAHGQWLCYAQAREAERQLLFYSVFPTNAPEERRAAVAELLTRANFGLYLGNFEMDWEDGEIRYKTSVAVEGAELTPALVRQVVEPNVRIMERYFAAIRAVADDGASPVEAIADAEAATTAS